MAMGRLPRVTRGHKPEKLRELRRGAEETWQDQLFITRATECIVSEQLITLSQNN